MKFGHAVVKQEGTKVRYDKKVYRIKNMTTRRFLKSVFFNYEEARSWLRRKLRKSPLYMPHSVDSYRNPRHSEFDYKIMGV